jgi:hypothetical protein
MPTEAYQIALIRHATLPSRLDCNTTLRGDTFFMEAFELRSNAGTTVCPLCSPASMGYVKSLFKIIETTCRARIESFRTLKRLVNQ